MALTKGFIRDAATTPLDARLMDMARVVQNSDGSPRSGVLGVVNGALLTALATMNVAVAAAPFVTSKGKADGAAIFTNDGTVNVAIATAPASNSRIDVIWVKHNDNTTGDTNALPTFGVTAGAAAASPTKPAIPTGALELGTLRVYAGTTAANGGSNTLTETYRMTAMQGGVVPFRNKLELDGWTTATDGQWATLLDDDSGAPFFVWNGTAWRHSSSVLAKTSSAPASQSVAGSAEVALTGMTVTFTLARAGDVRIMGGFNAYGSTDSVLVIRIKEGATILADFPRMANGTPAASAVSSYQNFFATLPFTAGTHTIQIYGLRALGGTVTIAPGSTNFSQLSAEMMD